MTESTMTIKNDEIEDVYFEESSERAAIENENMSILIPTLDFFAEVPPDLFPPLLPYPNMELKSDSDFESTDEKYSNLYHNLMASTARSTALANR